MLVCVLHKSRERDPNHTITLRLMGSLANMRHFNNVSGRENNLRKRKITAKLLIRLPSHHITINAVRLSLLPHVTISHILVLGCLERFHLRIG